MHAALSRLGYVAGGADTLIDAVLQVVGATGAVLMPSFPMTGSGHEFLGRGEPLDVLHSPSRVGLVTEVFRSRPDVSRSLHPTNPVTGWGARAPALLAGHDRSPTPFGANTPCGRLAQLDDSYILMVETHVHSFLHHLQERVGMPTLFLPGARTA